MFHVPPLSSNNRWGTNSDFNALMSWIVIVGNSINNDESEEQINFREYLIENDLNAYRKYSKMKEDFSKWCEDNVGYGF